MVLSPPAAEASLYRREAREKDKESTRGTMGRGKREERRFSGRICGSVVLAKPCSRRLFERYLKAVVKMVV